MENKPESSVQPDEITEKKNQLSGSSGESTSKKLFTKNFLNMEKKPESSVQSDEITEKKNQLSGSSGESTSKKLFTKDVPNLVFKQGREKCFLFFDTESNDWIIEKYSDDEVDEKEISGQFQEINNEIAKMKKLMNGNS